MFFKKQPPSKPSVNELRHQAIAEVNKAVAAAINAGVDLRELANLLESHARNLRMRDATTRSIW